MNARLFILAIGVATLAIVSGSGKPVAAGGELPSHADAPGQLAVRSLQRSSHTAATADTSTIRDPFAGTPPPSLVNDAAPPPPALTAKPVAPAFPAFRILGKQQDDDGWAVFITDGSLGGQVWVVRDGETFNENFRIGKLAPPVLVVRNTRTHQSRSFDIGKDESEE